MKTHIWTWEEIKKVWQETADDPYNTTIQDYYRTFKKAFDYTQEKYHKALAIALSVAKWMPETRWRGEGNCGLCWLYDGACIDCPLFQDQHKSCHQPGSLYAKAEDFFWGNCNKRTFDRRADKLYNVLAKLYKQEYDRLLKAG
jgi:hypothetical protein